MKIICAWKLPGCSGVIKEGPEEGPVSHGICPNCLKKVKEEKPNDKPKRSG